MKKILTLFAVLVFVATQFQLLAQVPNLVITEIMYNGPESGTDTTEFIEIYNNDTVAVNLSGYNFVQGISFTFPSIILDTNSYILVAYDSIKFYNTFGLAAYDWSGGLSNGGEDIILVTNNGDTVDIVDYDDGGIWPNSPDGNGTSLTFCNPSLDNNNGANWTAASNFVGTNSVGDSIWANPGTSCGSSTVVVVVSGDTIAPIVNSAIALNDTTIEVEFSELVDTTAENISNYSGISGIVTAVLDTTQMKVSLALSTDLVSGQSYNLTINNVKDTAQNVMDSAQTFTIMYSASVQTAFKVLLVNDGNTSTELSYIDTALAHSNYTYAVFDIDTIIPTYNDLKNYDMVIWVMANHGVDLNLWDVSDTTVNGASAVKFSPGLTQYLDSNGVVWIDGLDFLYDIYGVAPYDFNVGDFVYDNMGIDKYVAQSHADDGTTYSGLPMAIKASTNMLNTIDTIEWKWTSLWYADAYDITSSATSLYIMGPTAYPFSGKSVALYKDNIITSTLRIGSIGNGSNYVQEDIDSLVISMVRSVDNGLPVSGAPIVSDTIAPIVLSATVLSDSIISIVFSEAVDTTAENTNNYSGVGNPVSAIRTLNNTGVNLLLSTPLVSAQAYSLTISNVKDTAQNVMDSAQTFAVMYTAPMPSIIPNLVITEIMYNGPESGTDTTEFIEIYNNDTMAVNLAGYHFVQGFTYTFPSIIVDTNSYFVLAYDSVKFNNFFGTSAYQWTSGGLSNGGEDIILVTNNGDTVDVVDYDDGGIWPNSPDGNGTSLTFCNPSLDNNNGANWTAATTFVGTNSVGDSIWANPGVGCGVVSPPIPIVDSIAPIVISATALNDTVVEVGFSEVVDTTAENVNNYTGISGINSAVLSANQKYVNLSLSSALISGQTYNLIINNVKDTAQNIMDSAQTFAVMYTAPTPSIIPKLVITEIMYNGPESGTDTTEFIEIYNNDSMAVNLAGYHFVQGFTYTFPSVIIDTNSFFVLSLDSVKFNNFFGTTAYQWTSGSLKNSGEDIILVTDNGDTVDVVDYDDYSPWPTLADGNGPSLVLCNPNIDNNNGANWLVANTFVGINSAGDSIWANPGVACPSVPTPPSGDTIPPMVNNINVISSASVEIYFDEVVDTTAENINNYTGLGAINSAVLNTNGDMVTLVCANSFVNGSLNVLTVNNIADTVGNIMQQAQSFDFIYNASIESIVIDEIMYNDITDDDSLEYFEIVNNSTVAANISGYKVTEGVDYTFPANTIISSYGYLVIAKDSALINSTFGITGTHQWTSGGLKNSGEDIEIQNTVGDVIDYVDYDDANPWPVEADGDGYALEFHLGSGDNNIGSSWFTFNAFFAVFHGDTIYGTPGRDNIYESIEENTSLRNIRIYPNPANDIVYVKVEQGNYLVKIYSISGRIVKESKISNSNNSISIESLKSGIYMMIFVDEKTGAVGYRKLVIRN